MTNEGKTVAPHGETTRLRETLEKLGTVLCMSEGLTPDEAFWAIDGVSDNWGKARVHGWSRVIVRHMAVRYTLSALIFRKGGSFELTYQYSAIVECPDMWASHTMYSSDDWSAYQKGSCEISAAAAFELQGWFRTTQGAIDHTRVLHQATLDDKSVAQATADLLNATKLDAVAIASRRLETLQKHQLDDASVAHERAAALTNGGLDDENVQHLRAKLLKARGLDDAAIEARRLKVYYEAGLDDTFLQRHIAQILADEELDDESIRRRRIELLAHPALA